MSKDKISFLTMLRERGYRKIFVATIISRFGDSIDMIAYAYMVYQLTGIMPYRLLMF